MPHRIIDISVTMKADITSGPPIAIIEDLSR
jgi:hypothetical protein